MNAIVAEIDSQTEMMKPILNRMKRGNAIDNMSLSFVQLAHMRYTDNMKKLDDDLSDYERSIINKFKAIYSEIERLHEINSIKEKKNIV